MSQVNFILSILNLKDENIVFEEEFYAEEKVKGIVSKTFHAKLTFRPKACYRCGVVYDERIIKYGFKTSNIKLPNVSNFVTYLRLRKRGIFASIAAVHSF